MNGLTPAESATREAFEEAGVKGKAFNICVGHYSYLKFINKKSSLNCMVLVFPVKVTGLLKKFPEKFEREREWFTLKKAAAITGEPGLKPILRGFDPFALSGLRLD